MYRTILWMMAPLWNAEGGAGGGGNAGAGGTPNPQGGAGGAGGAGTPNPAGSGGGAGGNAGGGGQGGQAGQGGGAAGNDPANPFPKLNPNHQNGQGQGGQGQGGQNGQGGGQGENQPPSFLGAPENYADITVPEGFSVDKSVVDKFLPWAKQHDLSQKAVQELADFYAKEIVGPQSAAFVDQIATWFKETEADKEIGGDKFEASTQNASRALSVFGTPGLRQLMVQYGIGNHPEVVRFFARVGSALPAEDRASGGQGGGGAPATDFLTKMYGPPKQV